MGFKSENKLLSYRDVAKQIEKVRDLGKTPDIAVHVVLKNGKAFKKFGGEIFGLMSWALLARLCGDFQYATPSQFCRMPSRLSRFVSAAVQVGKICSPYVDKSTCQTFISRIPKKVETQLIVTKDVQWQNKVKAGLSGDFLAKFASGRRLITRRVDELRSRFIVIDDISVCLLSADLQTDQQTKRY